MKVKFLKNHLNNKNGDEITTTAEMGKYWLLVGLVSEVHGVDLHKHKHKK